MTRYLFYEMASTVALKTGNRHASEDVDAVALILIRTMRREGISDERIGEFASKMRAGDQFDTALSESGVPKRKISTIRAKLLSFPPLRVGL